MVQYRSAETIRTLAALVSDRDASFLAHATAQAHDTLVERYEGRRIAVLGAAGFIATQTLRLVLALKPSYIALVDVSENGLAEVIRTMRSSDLVRADTVVEAWLADISRPSLDLVVEEVGQIDVVLNFAAIKHVRSERDLPSLLRMLEVNILGSHKAAQAFRLANPDCHQFIVSTDKAADPANFMGASKRAMELAAALADPNITSARFANVAFSSGSLLESWLIRLTDRQPLTVPGSTWRYFVTPEEAGQVCLLSSIAPPGSVVIPDLSEDSLIALTDSLDIVLAHFGLSGMSVTSVEEGHSLLASPSDGRWPVLTTPRDTTGEKVSEVFLGVNEQSLPWIEGLRRIRVTSASFGVQELLDQISRWVEHPTKVTFSDIHNAVSVAVPNFTHVTAKGRLDDRA